MIYDHNLSPDPGDFDEPGQANAGRADAEDMGEEGEDFVHPLHYGDSARPSTLLCKPLTNGCLTGEQNRRMVAD